MKKFSSVLGLIMLCTVVVITTSCGGDDCTDANTLNTQINDGVTRVNAAITTFSNDPTESNCNELLNVLEDYINELEGLESCANDLGQGAEFQATLTSARNSLASTTCG